MSYTEFYCDFTNGNNLNGGGNEYAVKTYTSQIVAGGWNSATGVFTVAAGDPAADGVTVGSFASIYVTAGATVATFVARVTARDATTITVSLTAVSGTPPATDALGATTLKVGGEWKGPNLASAFPFNFAASTMTNASGHYPRINFQTGANYAVTAAMTANSGPIVWQGYDNTAGDGGRAIIDGGNPSAAYVILSLGANCELSDFIIQNNGTTTGTSNELTAGGQETILRNVTVSGIRGNGISISGAACVGVSLEAFNCNKSNTASFTGISSSGAGNTLIRCYSHDNTGSNAWGFIASVATTLIGCIADSNGSSGFAMAATTGSSMVSCDAYNNGAAGAGSGLELTGASAATFYIENSNFIDNASWGITSSGSSIRSGAIVNCGFGAGTAANGSGDINTNIGAMQVIGTVTYANNVTPWNAPTTGDFRITLAAAKASGIGNFNESDGSATGTVAYPAIGAAQPSAAATQRSYST